jgi:hypothetical protein
MSILQAYLMPMSKFKHDSFAKSYLRELLSTIGEASPKKRIKSEEREGDLWFTLTPNAKAKRHELGLLGKLLTRNSLIEVFRNAATAAEIRACLGKLFDLEAEMIRQAERSKKTLPESKLPDLWLIMPTASKAICTGFGAMPTRTVGVYKLPQLQRTGLIVVHQLPKTEETLFLRILGREGNQRRAIEEFTQQSSSDELHAIIGELLANYRAQLENLDQPLTEEEEELIMNLSTAYLKKQQEWLMEGRQEGRQEGIEEGEQRGIEQSRRETAIAALREGLAPELVARITGLSIATIEKLREDLA